jgi:hypothetical protein
MMANVDHEATVAIRALLQDMKRESGGAPPVVAPPRVPSAHDRIAAALERIAAALEAR